MQSCTHGLTRKPGATGPGQAMRYWVLSFPFELRFLLASRLPVSNNFDDTITTGLMMALLEDETMACFSCTVRCSMSCWGWRLRSLCRNMRWTLKLYVS